MSLGTPAINITGALSSYCASTRQAAFMTSIILLIMGLIFIAISLLIYFKKIRGQEKAKILWLLLFITSMALNLILLISGAMGILMHFTSPAAC